MILLSVLCFMTMLGFGSKAVFSWPLIKICNYQSQRWCQESEHNPLWPFPQMWLCSATNHSFLCQHKGHTGRNSNSQIASHSTTQPSQDAQYLLSIRRSSVLLIVLLCVSEFNLTSWWSNSISKSTQNQWSISSTSSFSWIPQRHGPLTLRWQPYGVILETTTSRDRCASPCPDPAIQQLCGLGQLMKPLVPFFL